MTIPTIVKKYRNKKSLRDFAGELSEKLPVAISHQTIKFWEDGTYKPRYYNIIPLAMHYTDWRREMALEILGVINPLWASKFREMEDAAHDESYSVSELIDIAGALEVAATKAVQQDILSIEAKDGWEAILKVLAAYHPEWDSISGFIQSCVEDLKEG